MRFGIFIYDGVEPIDLATFGVLSMARRVAPEIDICTIALNAGVVQLSNGLKVIADHGVDDAPECDVLIVTGGSGWEAAAADTRTLDFIRALRGRSRLMSVCTGAMILAASGVLDGRRATTKREVVPPERAAIEIMRERYPRIQVEAASLVDCGDVLTGGGVTLCIDATLHIISQMLGADVAVETARIMEYSRAWIANCSEFPPMLEEAPA